MKLALLALLCVATPVAAQQSRIEIIDVYGARSLGASEIRRASGLQPGDSVTANLEQVVRSRLRQALGVADAQVAFVCCVEGGAIAYLGVSEQREGGLLFKAAPTADLRLPRNIQQAQQRFDQALQDAVMNGQVQEDDSLGHALMRYAPGREIQQEFITYALGNVPVLREVLHHAADAQQRAWAAQIIAYAVNKHMVIPDLLEALGDADGEVRNNAMRALAVMARYAERHPEAGFRIPADPFIALLNSPFWTDRNKASMVLFSLSVDRNPALLQKLRATSMAALTDMVFWQAEGHALPAAFLLGRMGGLPEDAIIDAFRRDPNSLVQAARNPI
jgi:hypothetical protein